MRNVYTVKQVNAYIKNMFTQDFMLNRIYVKGEVSNCKYHTSGHVYFSLKDSYGMLSCVMFAGQRKGLTFPMKDGQQVIVLGNISTYERDGKYQLYANEVIPDGAGVLHETYEALKKELEEMGMFSEEYKQPIPFYAKKIGIVTAPTGAAIRDIINIASRRNPFVQMILYPALVQGEGAKESIAAGIRMLDKKGVDVIIVGRGGGSMEDLWAFNEEMVARAIFECRTPIISAVGHETDTTIADYVSDLRAPTPSAAAELAVREYRSMVETMEAYKQTLSQLLWTQITQKRQTLKETKLRLQLLHPRQKLNEQKMHLVDAEEQLKRGMEQKMILSRHKLAIYSEALKGLSPLEKLSNGFAYVESADGKAIRQADSVHIGEKVAIHLIDGIIHAEVTGKEEKQYGK